MITIDRYRPGDRPAVEALFRRMHGEERAEPYLARWRWQYERNPNLPDGLPLIWLVRAGDEVIGQYATMPVKLSVAGREIDAAWGMDVMILPEHQGRGLGRLMFETWDANVGASIGLGLTDASNALFTKLHWPGMGRVPRLIKPLAPRGADAATAWRRLRGIPSRARNAMTRMRPLDSGIHVIHRFDERATRLWERVLPSFAFAVRRDAAYLNWKFVEPEHVHYSIAAYVRGDEMRGYAVVRHVEQPDQRVTILVDFLADPAEREAIRSLLRWVDREALAARSHLIRTFATHAGFIATLRGAGFHDGPAGMRYVAKINAIEVPAEFYDAAAAWHVTAGDSDADR